MLTKFLAFALVSQTISQATSELLTCSEVKSSYKKGSCCESNPYVFTNLTGSACSCPIAYDRTQYGKTQFGDPDWVYDSNMYWVIVYQGLTEEEYTEYNEVYLKDFNKIQASSEWIKKSMRYWSTDHSKLVLLQQVPYLAYMTPNTTLKYLSEGTNNLPLTKITHNYFILHPGIFNTPEYQAARQTTFDAYPRSLYGEVYNTDVFLMQWEVAAPSWTFDQMSIIISDNGLTNLPETYDKELVHDVFQSQFYIFGQNENKTSSISLSSTPRRSAPQSARSTELSNERITNVFGRYPEVTLGYTILNLDNRNPLFNPLNMPQIDAYSPVYYGEPVWHFP